MGYNLIFKIQTHNKMRQSVYLALIGASQAIRISQTTQGACAAATLTVGCTTGTGSCADAAEKALNDTAAALTGAAAHTRRSCDTTKALGSLAQAACDSSLAVGCTNGTAKCGSAAETKANTDAAALTGDKAHSRRSCDTSKATTY